MIKKINFNLFITFFLLFFYTHVQADFQEQLIDKYKKIDTLYFNFIQKVGEKVETGNCFIKYPLLMKCEYPKKKKIIIANGKKFAIVKKRYKKIYQYPLKKTPLFYLLKKENILNLVTNNTPSNTNAHNIEYELYDNNSNKLKIFFNKNTLEPSGWNTIDAYSNEVVFIIENIKVNVLIKNEIFKIPKKEDL